MHTAAEENAARSLVGTLIRGWLLIVAAALLALLLSLVDAYQPAARFAATSTLQVDHARSNLFSVGSAPRYDDQAIPTAVGLLSSDRFIATVQSTFGHVGHWRVSDVSSVIGSELVQVQVIADKGAVAQGAANALVDAYVAQANAEAKTLSQARVAAVRSQLTGLQGEAATALDQLIAEQRTVTADQTRAAAAGVPSAVLAASAISLQALQQKYQGILASEQQFSLQLAQYNALAALDDGGAQVVLRAALPQGPLPRHVKRKAIMGTTIGVLVGVFAAFARSSARGEQRRHRRRLRRGYRQPGPESA